MGLIDLNEMPLRERHESLLRERKQVVSSRESMQRTIDVLLPVLQSKLQLHEDGEGVLARDVIKDADEKIGSLQRLLNERRETSSLATVETAEEEASRLFVETDAQRQTVDAQIRWHQQQIIQDQQASAASPYLASSPYEDCPSPDCPMRLASRPVPAADPAKDQRIAQHEEEISRLQQETVAAQAAADQTRAALTEARRAIKNERNRLAGECSGIERDIGLWQGYRRDAV